MVFRRKVKTRRNPKRRLRKRWHVGFNVGRNVPIVGGSSFSMGSGNFVKRLVRREMLKQQDVKQAAGSQFYQTGTDPLKHDTIHCCSPIMTITQGVNSWQRVGSEAFIRYMKIHGILGTGEAEVRYRVMCVATTKVYNPATVEPQNWAGIAQSFITDGLFIPATSTQLYSRLVNKQNTDFVVIHDKKYICRNDRVGVLETVPFDDTCKIMRKVEFSSTAIGPLKTWNYYVMIIPYCAGKAVGDPVGFVDSQYLITFTDS